MHKSWAETPLASKDKHLTAPTSPCQPTYPQKVWITLLCLLFLVCQSVTADLKGRVVSVIDGDTLKLLTGERSEIKVRLACIDAPEKNQPYGKKAKHALSDFVYGKTITVKEVDTDQYGRTLGQVYRDTLWANGEMVRQGYAWVYRPYAKRHPELYQFEREARATQKGLWALPADQRIPPWEWRRAEREHHLRPRSFLERVWEIILKLVEPDKQREI